jgi:hypothetical protein
MVQVIGYGEDALAYHVLTRLGEVLEQLHDLSDPSSCVLFYRPSFGRGGRSRALLGECDAILVTPRCTYLIESKWSGSNELSTGELAPRQNRRHGMINWVAKRWDGKQRFDEFCELNQAEFKKEFDGKELPPAGSGVFNRLFHVLSKAQEISADGVIRTKDILLVILEKDVRIKPIIVPEGFKAVHMTYVPSDGSNFFRMDQ